LPKPTYKRTATIEKGVSHYDISSMVSRCGETVKICDWASFSRSQQKFVRHRSTPAETNSAVYIVIVSLQFV